MNQNMKRALTCATGLAAALSVIGALGAPSQAQARADRQAERYAQILREDPTASLDSSGRLYYREPLPTGARARTGTMAPAAALQFPLEDTFTLHSNPGSQRTIYLDFDGGNVSNTAWNNEGLPNGNHPAWDPAGNGVSFNNAERTLVQEIWQWVAEDYAPFDVDVTTEYPGSEAAIVRSSSADQVFGTRALITPDDDAVGYVCGDCVGVAYLNVFDEVGGESQPVWIFPQAYGENAKGIAETISHEVGHNLNLEHDGNGQTEYAPGHDSWAPIMGNSDNEPISQWSKGDYPGASNQQDDFAVITGAGLSYRADEAGNSIGAAAPLPTTTAYITTRADKDFYDLGECSGSVQVAATGAALGTDVDIELRLYSTDGTQVAIANPISAKVSTTVASGMSATIDTSVGAGSYVVAVDGVGRGTWSTGYDDYASVGAYTLTVSGCDGGPVDPPPDPDPVVPGIPVITSVIGGPRGGAITASVGWAAPADDGGASITGYRIKATRWSFGRPVYQGYLDGLTADQTSVKIVLPRAGSWSFRIQATNSVGYGALSPSSRRVQAR